MANVLRRSGRRVVRWLAVLGPPEVSAQCSIHNVTHYVWRGVVYALALLKPSLRQVLKLPGRVQNQLLCQVAGRSGRGAIPGRVIIQTFAPEHYAIAAASRQDYTLFYRQEIDYRRRLNYPPFTNLVRLIYNHTNAQRCQKEAERVAESITERAGQSISLIGPAPAFVSRVRGHYYWQIILRGDNPVSVLNQITLAPGWTVDVDPVGLL